MTAAKHRIPFTSDLMPADILGAEVIEGIRFPMTPMPRRWSLAAFAAALCAEWTLRRRKGPR